MPVPGSRPPLSRHPGARAQTGSHQSPRYVDATSLVAQLHVGRVSPAPVDQGDASRQAVLVLRSWQGVDRAGSEIRGCGVQGHTLKAELDNASARGFTA